MSMELSCWSADTIFCLYHSCFEGLYLLERESFCYESLACSFCDHIGIIVKLYKMQLLEYTLPTLEIVSTSTYEDNEKNIYKKYESPIEWCLQIGGTQGENRESLCKGPNRVTQCCLGPWLYPTLLERRKTSNTIDDHGWDNGIEGISRKEKIENCENREQETESIEPIHRYPFYHKKS